MLVLAVQSLLARMVMTTSTTRAFTALDSIAESMIRESFARCCYDLRTNTMSRWHHVYSMSLATPSSRGTRPSGARRHSLRSLGFARSSDKGYISKDLKADLAKSAVDLVTPRKSNQLPPPKREQNLYQGHRILESAFSSLARLGLSDRPYRSTRGFVFHLYITILTY